MQLKLIKYLTRNANCSGKLLVIEEHLPSLIEMASLFIIFDSEYDTGTEQTKLRINYIINMGYV